MSWYDLVDLDILATAYSVHAIVKKKPQLPPRAVKLLASEEPISLYDETWLREVIYGMLTGFVTTKSSREYIDSILTSVQRERIRKENREVFWGEKQHLNSIRDAHWSDAQRRTEYYANCGKTWQKFTIATTHDD